MILIALSLFGRLDPYQSAVFVPARQPSGLWIEASENSWNAESAVDQIHLFPDLRVMIDVFLYTDQLSVIDSFNVCFSLGQVGKPSRVTSIKKKW